MKKFKQTKEIGLLNSLTQILTLVIFSGGAIFLLPLALSEITGWVLFGLWAGLNFIGLPLIIYFLNNIFNKSTIVLTIVKIILTGLTGGLLGFFLNIIYYKFHMAYIKKDFNVSDYYSDFLPIVTTLTITIIIAETIRILKTNFKAVKNV
jgi:hypothetical protein